MKKILIFIILLILTINLLNGCSEEYEKKQDDTKKFIGTWNETYIAEWFQGDNNVTNLSMTFYDDGSAIINNSIDNETDNK